MESIWETVSIALALCFLPIIVYIGNLKSEVNTLNKALQMWKDGALEMNEKWRESAERIAEMTKILEQYGEKS